MRQFLSSSSRRSWLGKSYASSCRSYTRTLCTSGGYSWNISCQDILINLTRALNQGTQLCKRDIGWGFQASCLLLGRCTVVSSLVRSSKMFNCEREDYTCCTIFSDSVGKELQNSSYCSSIYSFYSSSSNLLFHPFSLYLQE